VIITFSDLTGRMYDAVTGEELGKFSNKNHEIFDISVSPKGNYLLTTSTDGIPQISQAWSSWEELQNQIEKCCYRPFSDDEREKFALK
jgi:WD40 repeat protein